ncbi:hypothetical protein LIER_30315 [Lithospermum erythrorhizon]|uniref:Uncharacterized protein n=1 Tax=Lithospermum erythrorhizon TaxID=34254 RepID=A0AAV3RM90_LITER
MFRAEVRNEAPTLNIIGDESYCFPYMVDLTVKKKIMGVSDAHSDILDTCGNVLLRVDGSIWQLNRKRVVYNPDGLPIISIRRKAFKMREQWTVHRGDSSDATNFLYQVEESQFFQLKKKLDVFLSTNQTRNQPDFRLTASYLSQSFKVHKGVYLIAEVKEKFKVGSLIGKQSFEVRVYPGVDFAFIVSLLVILNEIVSGG